ncbi:MAG: undecaprenyl-diphosphate phosphatase [Chthoniobacterales bacterium]
MSWWEALVLGIVEGLTEYLPVSSTAHILLTQRLFGIGSSNAADAYAISIQGGAILAVLGLYHRRVFQMLQGVLNFGKNEHRDGFQLSLNILAAFLPAAIIGLAFNDAIKEYLFGKKWGLWPIVIAWFIGGVAILAVGWMRRNRKTNTAVAGFALENLTLRLALVIGFAQCIAMWPGVSRSLVTIVGGLLVGLSLPAAVEFSFLLGVLTLSAATVYDAYKHGSEMLSAFGPLPLIIGFLAAWLSALLAVKWMVTYLQRHGLAIFGYYRIGIAVLAAAAIWLGWLQTT